MRTVEVGAPDDWAQRVWVRASGATPAAFQVTPKNGKVNITFRTQAGLPFQWDGSAWVQQVAFIDLATTISGKESRYAFTVPTSVGGNNPNNGHLSFRGWINGDFNTLDEREALVVDAADTVKLVF